MNIINMNRKSKVSKITRFFASLLLKILFLNLLFKNDVLDFSRTIWKIPEPDKIHRT